MRCPNKREHYGKEVFRLYRVSRIHLRKMFGKKELFEMNYKNWRTDENPETIDN